MSKKSSKITVVKKKFNAAVETTKDSVKKANEFALHTTEEVFNETFTIAEQWQKVSVKAIKEGFKLASKQQDIVFDGLDTFKGQLTQGKRDLQSFSLNFKSLNTKRDSLKNLSKCQTE